ncbi:MAG: hypothetical protein KatS3mg083_086 [Candidatus Dojkabacteria bacterium]|nr:MAG: hypothetical protein KatS3mg083_086 [Candidatus Dojkabacteria bacterium]
MNNDNQIPDWVVEILYKNMSKDKVDKLLKSLYRQEHQQVLEFESSTTNKNYKHSQQKIQNDCIYADSVQK